MPLNSRGQRVKQYETAKSLRKRKPKKSTGGTRGGAAVGGGT